MTIIGGAAAIRLEWTFIFFFLKKKKGSTVPQ